MDVRKMRNELLGKRLVAALESRNMEAYYVETKEEAVKKALELIPKGSSINMGGATSVKECGLYEALSNGEYQFYDRDKVSTQEEKQEIALKAFTSDYFLGSVNAMSEDGVFINIDGNANRVAAYAYGPKHVLLIVGMNKVVKTEADAMSRARNEAAPINAQRFGIDTPCSKNNIVSPWNLCNNLLHKFTIRISLSEFCNILQISDGISHALCCPGFHIVPLQSSQSMSHPPAATLRLPDAPLSRALAPAAASHQTQSYLPETPSPHLKSRRKICNPVAALFHLLYPFSLFFPCQISDLH
jgi:hypothetical protein